VFLSAQDVQAGLFLTGYIAEEITMTIVYLAANLNKPILVEGPPVCKSPFQEIGFNSSGQSQLTPSCFLHNQVTSPPVCRKIAVLGLNGDCAPPVLARSGSGPGFEFGAPGCIAKPLIAKPLIDEILKHTAKRRVICEQRVK
jgi:hypothetical protein